MHDQNPVVWLLVGAFAAWLILSRWRKPPPRTGAVTVALPSQPSDMKVCA